jgi:hypothetical protein
MVKNQGLKKYILKEHAGRLNTGFFTGFSGKTGFMNMLLNGKCLGVKIDQNDIVKYAISMKAAWNVNF